MFDLGLGAKQCHERHQYDYSGKARRRARTVTVQVNPRLKLSVPSLLSHVRRRHINIQPSIDWISVDQLDLQLKPSLLTKHRI